MSITHYAIAHYWNRPSRVGPQAVIKHHMKKYLDQTFHFNQLANCSLRPNSIEFFNISFAQQTKFICIWVSYIYVHPIQNKKQTENIFDCIDSLGKKKAADTSFVNRQNRLKIHCLLLWKYNKTTRSSPIDYESQNLRCMFVSLMLACNFYVWLCVCARVCKKFASEHVCVCHFELAFTQLFNRWHRQDKKNSHYSCFI